jgi:hypothetical protein
VIAQNTSYMKGCDLVWRASMSRTTSMPDAGSVNTALRGHAYPHASSGRLTTIGVAVLRTTTQ